MVPAAGLIVSGELELRGLLLQLALVIATARLLGNAALRVGQPRVVGEIVGGLLLGPSLLGALAPGVFARLFPEGAGQPLHAFSQVGLILLMLQVGMEFDYGRLREKVNRRAVLAVTVGSILLPLAGGVLMGLAMHPQLAAGVPRGPFCGFVAVALSITALPILGRILIDFRLTASRLGIVTISAAAINDVIGWLLLGVVSSWATSRFSLPALAASWAAVAASFLVAYLLARPLLRWLVRRTLGSQPEHDLGLEAWIAALALAFGVLTIELGIFALFGGFLLGVLLHRERELVERWKRRAGPFLEFFFLPVFFTYTGLRTDAAGLADPAHWAWCVVVVAVATGSKLVGAWIGARWAGMSEPEARCIAVMMNTRALMELVVLNVGYDLGVLPKPVFTMLVLMAIFSTVLTGPLLRRSLPRVPALV